MSHQRKLNTFEPDSNYKVLLTAALEYATGNIHLGHLKSTFLPPQQLNSYLNMRQKYFAENGDNRSVESVYIGGLDCHGVHVAMTAKNNNKSLDKFIKKSAKKHKKLLKKAGVNFTHYAPTHIPENEELTKKAFFSMRDNGYLVEKEVDGVHCSECGYNPPPHDISLPSDKSIVTVNRSPELTVIHEGVDPALLPREFKKELLEFQYHKDCGEISIGKLTYLEGLKHHHLNLEKLRPDILKFLSEVNTQEQVRKYQIKNFEGRDLWDFTRENNWGWPIPGTDGEKQFYVWFDAPFGYISGLMDYFKKKGEPERFKEFTQGENALMIHHMGKDIQTHHHILWPAILSAYNAGVPEDEKINLPSEISVRGHLKVYQKDENGEIRRDEDTGRILTDKMSKSEGNAPSLDEIVDKYSSDMVSFYLSLTNPQTTEDTIYDEGLLIDANNLFANKISNFVSRTLKFVKNRSNNKIPTYIENLLDEEDKEFISVNKSIFKNVGQYIENGDHKRALEEIVNFAQKANEYIQERKPWDNNRSDDFRNSTIYLCANTIKNLSLLLYPYTPDISERIRGMLNVDYEWVWPDEGQIDLQSGQKIGKIKHLVERSKKRKGQKKKGKK